MAEFETPAQGIVFFLLFGMQTVVVTVVLVGRGVISVPGGVFILALTLGMYGLLIVIPIWQDSDSEGADEDSHPSPVEQLKQRYAAGELSEEELEQKLDQLLDSDQKPADVDELDVPPHGDEDRTSSSAEANSSRSTN
jgi:uncharacterized membrane protein